MAGLVSRKRQHSEARNMESRFVSAAGLRMHYLEHGTGKPVIAIHGWPETCHEWRRVAPLLGSEYRILAPDTRGHGQTEAPPDGYDRAQLARDIVAFMDAHGIDRCPVVAHDWGGIIAVKLALDHGERVERLCLLDTICTGWPTFVQYYYWFMDGDRAERFFAGNAEAFIRSVIGGQQTGLLPPPECPFEFQTPELTTPESWTTDEDIDAYVAPYRDGDDGRVTCAYYRAMEFHRVVPDPDAPNGERYEPVSHETMGAWWREQTIPLEYLDYAVEDRHKRYDGPTLWLYGETVADASGAEVVDGVPRGDPAWDSFSRHFPDLTGHPMGGGHFFVEARPQETARHIREFLAG